MNLIKYIVSIFLLITSAVMADPLDQFVSSIDEQKTVATWIRENAQVSITEKQALSIAMDIYAYALSSDLDPLLLTALVRTESGFNTKAKSNHHALGLMQVMYKIHYNKFINKNPFDPTESIRVGTIILKECFVKHKNNRYKSLNCYSGGGGYKYTNTISKYEEKLNTYILKNNESSSKTLFAYAKIN